MPQHVNPAAPDYMPAPPEPTVKRPRYCAFKLSHEEYEELVRRAKAAGYQKMSDYYRLALFIADVPARPAPTPAPEATQS